MIHITLINKNSNNYFPNSSADPQVAIPIQAWVGRRMTKSWRQKVTPLQRPHERPCLDPSSHHIHSILNDERCQDNLQNKDIWASVNYKGNPHNMIIKYFILYLAILSFCCLLPVDWVCNLQSCIATAKVNSNF